MQYFINSLQKTHTRSSTTRSLCIPFDCQRITFFAIGCPGSRLPGQSTPMGTQSLLTTVFLLGASTPATPQLLTVFDAPNAYTTSSSGINDRGDVTGYFEDTSQGLLTRGFVRDRYGAFTVFDAPTSARTVSLNINSSGQTTGWFVDSSQNFRRRGFVRDPNGRVTAFDATNAVNTFGLSINP